MDTIENSSIQVASERGRLPQFRDALVNLPTVGSTEGFAEYVASFARLFDAHLTCIAFAYKAVLAGVPFEGFPSDILDQENARSKQAAQQAQATFDKFLQREKISSEAYTMSAESAQGASSFAVFGRHFDLSICQQSDHEVLPQDPVLEVALFESGRPVLVVPYIQRERMKLDRITICWDSSAPAARALHDALPLLLRAKAVEILTVPEERKELGTLEVADIGRHLSRHGLKVHIKSLLRGEVSVADVIQSHVADNQTDLLVMGAYGHSRFREFLFGGVTKSLLESMTTPTFMSH